MPRQTARLLAATVALTFGFEIALVRGMTSEALAFEHGGGHFGGGHFGGGHFGGMHFGRHFGGGHFGGRHFGGMHFGGRQFSRMRLGGTHVGQAHLGDRLSGRTAFDRSQFAGAKLGRFNGMHGFRSGDFNRNAFGRMGAWNHWAGDNWGDGWSDWGAGWGYWAGPVFWPFFYGDMLSFALWPYGLYDPFFAYGPDYLLAGIFWPGPLVWPYFAYDPYEDYGLANIYGFAPRIEDSGYYAYYGRHRHHKVRTDARANFEVDTKRAVTCTGLAPGVMDLPFDQIERVIRPTNAQLIMLDDLKAASAHADTIMRSSCPDEVPLTPISRLDAIAKRIHAMSEAVQILRGPLAALYMSLDERQQDRFAALGAPNSERRSRTANSETHASNSGALCKQQPESVTQLPVQRIEETIKPTEQQKATFEALKSASAKAASSLEASCPTDVPETLTARLDALAKRLDALASAVNTIKPALNDFYNSLSDEQKARFNIIGGTSHSSFTPSETRSRA